MIRIENYTNCIYSITFKNSNKIYIGKANSSLQRWGAHIQALISNKHENKIVKSIYKEHGLECFIFSIIRHGLKEEELYKEELLEIAKQPKENICNQSCIFRNSYAIVNYDTETYEIVSLKYLIETYGLEFVQKCNGRLYGKKISVRIDKTKSVCDIEMVDKVLNIQTCKKIYQVDKSSNEIISKFSSITEAAEVTGLSKTYIRNCINGKLTTLNLEFYFSDDENNLIFESKPVEYAYKKVTTYHISDINTKLEFKGVKECARHFDIAPSVIRVSNRLNNFVKKGKMFGWKFEIEQ